MRINLRTEENQYRKTVVTEYYKLEEGGWVHYYLNCLGSENMDMGTCRCNSHSTWGESRVSRQDILGDLKSDEEDLKIFKGLDDEIIQDLKKDDLETLITDVFWASDFEELGEVYEAMEMAYKLGANPLPALRKKFEEAELNIGVVYRIMDSGTSYDFPDDYDKYWIIEHDPDTNNVGGRFKDFSAEQKGEKE